MEEQNHNQPQPTKPHRPRRKWPRWLAVPAGVAVLALVYQLTRPPELVWWKSPEIDSAGHHIRCRIPFGWQEKSPGHAFDRDTMFIASFNFVHVDRRPVFLKRLFPAPTSIVRLYIDVYANDERTSKQALRTIIMRCRGEGWDAERVISTPDGKEFVRVFYLCANRAVLNRTYKQICDSLTIE